MDQAHLSPAFVADSIGLDFLNSLATPVNVPVEWLASGEELLQWLGLAKLVPHEVLTEFKQSAGPGELDALAAQARGLREWFRTFVLTHKGRPLSASAISELEAINRLLSRDERFGQIVLDNQNAHIALVTQRRWRSPEALLLPIAEAIANVVCDEDFTHVKSCQGHGCTMVFVDKTKSHARRWCSMSVCGNRAKQAAHRARKPS